MPKYIIIDAETNQRIGEPSLILLPQRDHKALQAIRYYAGILNEMDPIVATKLREWMDLLEGKNPNVLGIPDLIVDLIKEREDHGFFHVEYVTNSNPDNWSVTRKNQPPVFISADYQMCRLYAGLCNMLNTSNPSLLSVYMKVIYPNIDYFSDPPIIAPESPVKGED